MGKTEEEWVQGEISGEEVEICFKDAYTVNFKVSEIVGFNIEAYDRREAVKEAKRLLYRKYGELADDMVSVDSIE